MTEKPKDQELLSALSPTRPRPSSGTAFPRLPSKGDIVDDEKAEEMARKLSTTGFQDETPPAPAGVRRSGRRPVSPISPNIEIPYEDEEIEWDAHVRAIWPQYLDDQLSEYAHQRKCTKVSAIIHFMANMVDAEGKSLFHVRKADLVSDRRKAKADKRNKLRRPGHYRED